MKCSIEKLSEMLGNDKVQGPLTRIMGIEKFPAVVKMRIARIVFEAREKLKPVEVAHHDLVKQYGEAQPDGSIKIIAGSEGAKKFDAEIKAVLDEEVEIEAKMVMLKPKETPEAVTAEMLAGLVGVIEIDEEAK